MKLEVIMQTEQETKDFAAMLATLVSPGDVITLEGDLGAGKTTFTQGLAVGLGIKRNVTSPTFTIIKEYSGRMPLYHMDVYRLEYSDEDIGFDEYFYGDGVTVVEWAQFIDEFLPSKRLNINIVVIDGENRSIRCESTNEYFHPLIKQLQKTVER